MSRVRLSSLPLPEQAQRLGITVPGNSTLRKYGMTTTEWLEMLAAQGWQCPICERRVARWNIDHEHVVGWKKMPSQQRRRFVRGLLCIHCNWRLVNSRMSAATAQRVADYLRAYEARRDAQDDLEG